MDGLGSIERDPMAAPAQPAAVAGDDPPLVRGIPKALDLERVPGEAARRVDPPPDLADHADLVTADSGFLVQLAQTPGGRALAVVQGARWELHARRRVLEDEDLRDAAGTRPPDDEGGGLPGHPRVRRWPRLLVCGHINPLDGPHRPLAVGIPFRALPARWLHSCTSVAVDAALDVGRGSAGASGRKPGRT